MIRREYSNLGKTLVKTRELLKSLRTRVAWVGKNFVPHPRRRCSRGESVVVEAYIAFISTRLVGFYGLSTSYGYFTQVFTQVLKNIAQVL
jgi:hypothetical protein